jgi:hypothetical protein
MKRLFTTVDALLGQDEAAPLEWGTFDDELWLLLSDRIIDPSQPDNYPDQWESTSHHDGSNGRSARDSCCEAESGWKAHSCRFR